VSVSRQTQLALQSHACAACRRALTPEHPTGTVRGWVLCEACYDLASRATPAEPRQQCVSHFLARARRCTWDEHFLAQAHLAATRSKDPSTQVGAVLVRDRRVLATGYNGYPAGVPDVYVDAEGAAIPKADKYRMTIHAELNALLSAAREGVVTAGASLYVSTLFPCAQCAGAVIQAGVCEVVSDHEEDLERWADQNRTARSMFEAAGVIHRGPVSD